MHTWQCALYATVTNHNDGQFLAYNNRDYLHSIFKSPVVFLYDLLVSADFKSASKVWGAHLNKRNIPPDVVSKLGTIQFAGPMATGGGGELLIKRSITPAETNYSKCPTWKMALW